jgi:DNA-binding NarL/FixJ family response regulator
VDADRRVRESLADLLGLGDDLEVVGGAGHLAAALDLCAEQAPDVIVLDPRLPDVDGGLALVGEVRRRFPRTAVLVVSWPGTAAEHVAVDADGIVAKSADPHEFVEQIVLVARAAAARGGGTTRDASSGRPAPRG